MNDQFDLPLSSSNSSAVHAYDRAIDHQLHAWPGGLAALDEAVAIDPTFALAHAARALVLASQGRGAEARQAIAFARDHCTVAHERERSHVALLAHLIEGRAPQALAAVIEHAERWPTDALAMSTVLGAFGLFAFSGRADHDAARLAFVQRIAPHYPADNAWMLAHLSWCHTEAGRPDVGLALIERSLAKRRANGNAAHVMMHARFERGETDAALAFIDDWLLQYPDTAMLFGHLHWHAALCEIEVGRTDAAVQRLVGRIEPHLQHALPLVGMTDTASLLWRLRSVGCTELSWANAQAYAVARFPQGANVFGELHLAMLAAARRDADALIASATRLQKLADAGHEGAVVALSWTQGLTALVGSDGDAAQEHLRACLAGASRLGGSHAQRAVVGVTLAAVGRSEVVG